MVYVSDLLPTKVKQATIHGPLVATLILFAMFPIAATAADDALRNDALRNEVLTWLPDSVVGYAEILAPADTIEAILRHPLKSQIEQLAPLQKGLRSKEYIQFRLYISWIELQLGMGWQETISRLTQNGLYLAVDSNHGSVALIAAADQPGTVTKVKDTLLAMARRHANRNKTDLPYEEHEYRGVTAYKLDKLVIAQLDHRLLVSPKPELAKQIVDRWKDNDQQGSLGRKPSFEEANRRRSHGRINTFDAWGYLDLAFVRRSGGAKELFREHAENIAAEFLFGTILEAVGDTSYLAAQVALSSDELQLSLSVPHDPGSISRSREFAFGPNGHAHAPFRLEATRTIADVTAYRDLGQLWLAKEDLFEENQIAELAQADSNLTTVFSGLDFGEEVLGAAKPGIQFVAALQDFTDHPLPKPDIQLPGFAVIVELREPGQIQRRLKIAFQSFIGFINIQQAQNGQPQFDLETTREANATMTTAQYFVDEAEADRGLINFNFSPTIAFVDDWFILASTRQLATDLTRKAGTVERPGCHSNAELCIEAAHLREILMKNREQLVAQNMLEKGHGRAKAEDEVGILIDLLATPKLATLCFGHREKHFCADLTVSFEPAETSKDSVE